MPIISANIAGLATKKFKVGANCKYAELLEKLQSKFNAAHFDTIKTDDADQAIIEDDESLEIALDEAGDALKLVLSKAAAVLTFARSTSSAAAYKPQSERWSNDVDFNQVCQMLNPTNEPPLGVVAVGALVRRGPDWHWGDIDGIWPLHKR